jgi:prepilin-type N-terminal cleavage/methylation domain-containing protein
LIKFNQLGFTLLEVLIAIVLLGFISLYTYKMVDNNTDTKDRVLKEDQLLMQTLTAMNRLDNDISQMYTPLYSFNKSQTAPTADYQNGQGDQVQDNYSQQETNPSFDGRTKNGLLIPQFISDDRSSIQFFTTANRRKIADSKESRYAWIKYSLQSSTDEEDKKFGGYDLVRQILPVNIFGKDVLSILKDQSSSHAKAQVVLTRIKSLSFSFWDERSRKFVSSLQELNENKNLIRSLKVELVWIDDNHAEQKLEKNFRILYPLFHAKQDDLNMGAGMPGSSNPGIIQ